MPQDWTEPEEALQHRGITVWHVYKDDDYQAGCRDTWYSFNISGSDYDSHGECGTFQVDDLPEIPEELEEKYEKYVEWERSIRYAIDSGYFKDWAEIDQDLDPANLKPEDWVPTPALTREQMRELFWRHVDPNTETYCDYLNHFLQVCPEGEVMSVLINLGAIEGQGPNASV